MVALAAALALAATSLPDPGRDFYFVCKLTPSLTTTDCVMREPNWSVRPPGVSKSDFEAARSRYDAARNDLLARPVFLAGGTVGSSVEFTLHWPRVAPAGEARLPERIVPAKLSLGNSHLDISMYYPDRAQRFNVKGQATLRCAIRSDMGLDLCRVIGEYPADFGFGPAAMKLVRHGHVDANRQDIGADVKLIINFNTPDVSFAPPPAVTGVPAENP